MRTILGSAARRAIVCIAGSTALAGSGLAFAAQADAQTVHASSSWTRACALATTPGAAACNALRVNNVVEHVHATGVTPNATPSGYGPSDLYSAYKLPTGGGAGKTVAIVDAYNDPNAESDLAVYRAQYGLPACTTANGCFRKVNQSGGTSYPSNNSGWAGEISLDLDMVSAIAPNAHILLVEASSSDHRQPGHQREHRGQPRREVRLQQLRRLRSPPPTRATTRQYFNHPGVAVTARSGDSGYGVEYPAASQYVTAVGGTALTRASNSPRLERVRLVHQQHRGRRLRLLAR